MLKLKLLYPFLWFIRILFLGMINFKPSSIVLKDPITGINDIIKDGLNLTRDQQKGVWIGKRALDSCKIGVASLFFENFGLNYLHYCFRIEGVTYHLSARGQKNTSGKKKGQGSIRIQKITDKEEMKKFEWYYKGPSHQKKEIIEKLILKFNRSKQKYCTFTKNCQHFAKTLAMFARGTFKEKRVQQLLLDKDNPVKLTWHFVFQCTWTSVIELWNVVKKYFQK